jgi:hypothetical protein
MKKLSVGFVAAAAVVAAGVAYFGFGSLCTASGAHRALKESVLDTLKSPASAVFADTARIDAPTSCFYKISGAVDAQNSFGAMMRMTYSGTVIDRDYKVLSVSVQQ